MRHDRARGASLVAYVASSHTRDALVAELRSLVAASLPQYMAPAAYVVLDTLPSTPNGRLDRKALLAIELERDTARAHIAPRNDTEEIVAAVWCDVLDRPEVGARDNFFDLGGHSLLMLKVYEALHGDHHRLALVDLFHHPTVTALARFLSDGGGVDHERRPATRGEQRRTALRRQRERRIRARTGG